VNNIALASSVYMSCALFLYFPPPFPVLFRLSPPFFFPASDISVCGLCANTVDHLATYIFLNRTRDKPAMRAIAMHVASNPEVLYQLMNTLFTSLLFGSQANHWAITRPILSLMLAAEDAFTHYRG
jgi:hypothetical protein